MEKTTEENLKLAEDQLKLSLETTQEFMDMWTKSYQSTLGKLAQVPAFGPVREKQEKIMKSMPLYSKLYTTWVDSNVNLQSVLLEAMRKTFEKTVEYQINSAECAKDGKSCVDPEKYKEFYKIWIDAYSETFKDFMQSEHYSSDMAKFASIFIDFQKHNREMIEENYLKPNNLPTKTDIDEIHKELYSLRKTVKELVRDIKELSKESPKETPKEAQKETQKEAQKETQKEAQKETQKDKPLETDETLSKKVEPSKPQKVELPRKVEQTKKVELPNKKEVHI